MIQRYINLFLSRKETKLHRVIENTSLVSKKGFSVYRHTVYRIASGEGKRKQEAVKMADSCLAINNLGTSTSGRRSRCRKVSFSFTVRSPMVTMLLAPAMLVLFFVIPTVSPVPSFTVALVGVVLVIVVPLSIPAMFSAIVISFIITIVLSFALLILFPSSLCRRKCQ